jgi:hypothetical protein
MNPQFLKTARVVELLGGILVLLLAFWMWLHILLLDWSNGFKPDSGDIGPFLMFVGPGMVLAIGSLIQTIFHKLWAVPLVIVSALVNTGFTGVNMLFLFAYTGDKWGLRAVFADIFLVVITVTIALMVAFPEVRKAFA